MLEVALLTRVIEVSHFLAVMPGETAECCLGDGAPELSVVPVSETVEDDTSFLPIGDADFFQGRIESVSDKVTTHGPVGMVEIADDPVLSRRSC